MLVALVVIVATSGLQAFADTYSDTDRAGAGTPANPEQAVISKHLEMPIGTTPPNATFTFDFTPLSGTTLPSNSQPDIGISTQAAPPIASIDAVITPATPTTAQPEPRADVVRATVHTADALHRTSPNNIVWPGPGVFVYQVTERTNTFTNTATEHMYFAATQYNLYVTIGEAADGTLYVRGSHAWERDPVTGDNVGSKLNPNPWRPGPGANEGGSDLIFVNRFIRRTDDIPTTPGPGPGPERPIIPGPGTPEPGPGGTPNPGVPGGLGSSLIISKRVTGSKASANSTFTFTGALTHTTLVNEVVADPGIADSATTYGPVVAWVYHNNGDGFVRGRRTPAETLPTSYTFTPGATAAEFQLRHGEVLIFERVPVGNIFVATETNSLTYNPSIDLVVNGQAITPRAALTIPGTIGTANVGTPPHRVGEASNIAAFTNTNESVPITGLVINNLPIILVAVGTIGLMGVTVVSKKRRAYE